MALEQPGNSRWALAAEDCLQKPDCLQMRPLLHN